MNLKYFSPFSTDEELKKRYRALSIKYHPDKPGGDVKKMQDINAEYDYVMKNREIFRNYIPSGQPFKETGKKIDPATIIMDFFDVINARKGAKKRANFEKLIFDIFSSL